MLVQLLRLNLINTEQQCEVGVASRCPTHCRTTLSDVAAVHRKRIRLIGFHYAHRSRRTVRRSAPGEHLWAQHESVLFLFVLENHQI